MANQAPSPSKPVTIKNGVGTTADPNNCPGSGKPWDTGGKCPVCQLKADQLISNYNVVARRGDGNLTPRVPRHPALGTAGTDATTSADASVLDGVTSPATTHKPPRPARSAKPTASGAAKSTPASPPRPARPASSPKTAPAKTAATAPANDTKQRKTKDPLTAPFTKTIEEYLVWLQKALEAGGQNWSKLPRERLAGLAITMYGRYQVSPERRAARNGH